MEVLYFVAVGSFCLKWNIRIQNVWNLSFWKEEMPSSYWGVPDSGRYTIKGSVYLDLQILG